MELRPTEYSPKPPARSTKKAPLTSHPKSTGPSVEGERRDTAYALSRVRSALSKLLRRQQGGTTRPEGEGRPPAVQSEANVPHVSAQEETGPPPMDEARKHPLPSDTTRLKDNAGMNGDRMHGSVRPESNPPSSPSTHPNDTDSRLKRILNEISPRDQTREDVRARLQVKLDEWKKGLAEARTMRQGDFQIGKQVQQLERALSAAARGDWDPVHMYLDSSTRYLLSNGSKIDNPFIQDRMKELSILAPERAERIRLDATNGVFAAGEKREERPKEKRNVSGGRESSDADQLRHEILGSFDESERIVRGYLSNTTDPAQRKELEGRLDRIRNLRTHARSGDFGPATEFWVDKVAMDIRGGRLNPSSPSLRSALRRMSQLDPNIDSRLDRALQPPPRRSSILDHKPYSQRHSSSSILPSPLSWVEW